MPTSSSAVLLNAFQPDMEIDDPNLFAGRKDQLILLAKALHGRGTCPIIYGDRGLGKSSLALQGARIATGDVTLLARYRALDWEFSPDDEFLPFYVTCTDATKTTTALLQRVINALGDAERGETRRMGLMDKTTRKSFKLKLFEAQFERRYELDDAPPTYASKDLEERLVELATRHTSSSGQPVLIVIDELDRLDDTAGLASFIKAYSSDGLKFLLVGIAQNVSGLLADHSSIERIAKPIGVPIMQPTELMLIVDNAMDQLRVHFPEKGFSPAATSHLAEVAAGYPWFVHVLAQSALLIAHEEGSDVVQKLHVLQAIAGLATSDYAHAFNDKYQRAVHDSRNREIVLRSFAQWYDHDVPTSEAYRVLRDYLGVKHPSTYLGHLCSVKYGRVFLRPPHRAKGQVRFANEMFKVYVRLRSSVFKEVDREVTEAWQTDFPPLLPNLGDDDDE